MKTSIRAKLFIGLTVVILFFVAFSIFLNNNYLESYYLHQKMDLLDSTAKLIDEQYSGAPEDILLALEGAESTVSVNVLILDSRLQVKYLSLPRRNPDLRSDPSLDTIIERYDELVRYGSFNLITRDLRLNADFLNLVYLLNNRDILILSTPLAAIQANAAVAKLFSLHRAGNAGTGQPGGFPYCPALYPAYSGNEPHRPEHEQARFQPKGGGKKPG